MQHWMLDENRQPIAVEIGDLARWKAWFQHEPNRRVGLDTVGDYRVVTSFRALDERPLGKQPRREPYQTALYWRHQLQAFERRYPTWEAAAEGHRKVVEMIREKLSE